jgi:hypothetical protein
MTNKQTCDHCGRPIRGSIFSILHDDGSVNAFHDDRRACRIASHEYATPDWLPPEASWHMDSGNYGAALCGFDYVRWPWWLRWVPDSWLDGLRSEVAVRVGGSVERYRDWVATTGGIADD